MATVGIAWAVGIGAGETTKRSTDLSTCRFGPSGQSEDEESRRDEGRGPRGCSSRHGKSLVWVRSRRGDRSVRTRCQAIGTNHGARRNATNGALLALLRNKKPLVTSASLLRARTLLGAPGLTSSNKKLLVGAPEKLLGVRGFSGPLEAHRPDASLPDEALPSRSRLSPPMSSSRCRSSQLRCVAPAAPAAPAGAQCQEGQSSGSGPPKVAKPQLSRVTPFSDAPDLSWESLPLSHSTVHKLSMLWNARNNLSSTPWNPQTASVPRHLERSFGLAMTAVRLIANQGG